MSLTAALIAQGVGSAIDSGVQLYEGYKNRQFTAQENQKARDWQEYMSNTAYQRTANDLEKAGLNRLLAYGSNPSTFTASGSSSQTGASVSTNFSGIGLEMGRLNAQENKLNLEKEKEFDKLHSQQNYLTLQKERLDIDNALYNLKLQRFEYDMFKENLTAKDRELFSSRVGFR